MTDVHFVLLITPGHVPGDILETYYYGPIEISQDQLQRRSDGTYNSILTDTPELDDWTVLEIWRSRMSEWLVSQGFRRIPLDAPSIRATID